MYVVIEKNLRHLGYEVTVVHNNHYPFTVKDLAIKIKYKWRKMISGYKEDNQELINIYMEEKKMSLIKSTKFYDLCLVIRADVFSQKLLTEAKRRSGKFISFFYDGLTFNQHILPLIPFFDRFYIFDKTELDLFKDHGIRYAPNFYVDYPEINKDTYDHGNKIYYISSYNPSRVAIIESFYKYIVQRIYPIQFDLIYNKNEEYDIPDYIKQHFNCIQTIVPYEEQLKLIRNTEIILDFKMTFHSGFSFRIFDGIKLKKKVITTNPFVVDEDFYHPDNFFVLTENNENELDDFLQRPYVPLDDGIRTKYSFESWLKAVTDY
ncbi:hypothetical protein GCM10028774_62050 [Spirosoma jeollabukense]